MNISRPHLVLLVSALNDAIRFNGGFLRSETVRDISDCEEHLANLEDFQAWLETEYEKLEKQHPDLIKYDEIVRR